MTEKSQHCLKEADEKDFDRPFLQRQHIHY